MKYKIILVFSLFCFLFNKPSYCQEQEAAMEGLLENSYESHFNYQRTEELKYIDPEEHTLLKGYISKVPGGTKLKIIFETPVDELTSMVDDEITARISEDVVVNNDVAIPAGSVVTGRISEINLAKRLHRAGSVRIIFESLSVPDGYKIPIVASVLTHSGLLKGRLTKRNALISTASVVAPALAGFGGGLAADGSALGAVVGTALGAIAGISLFAYEKGNMVDIKAGEELSIELIEDASVPIQKLKNVSEQESRELLLDGSQ